MWSFVVFYAWGFSLLAHSAKASDNDDDDDNDDDIRVLV
jgi:hypothetical protein